MNKRKNTFGEWEEWDDDKCKKFAEQVGDDKNNFVRVMRDCERLGLIETFIGPNGKLWCRRKTLSEREVAAVLLECPRSRLMDQWLRDDDERMIVKETTNPDHLSDDALRLLCVLVTDLVGLKFKEGKTREFEPGVLPSALCDLIGERRTKNAMAELEAVDPDALAFSKHGIFAMKVYTDARRERRR